MCLLALGLLQLQAVSATGSEIAFGVAQGCRMAAVCTAIHRKERKRQKG